MAAKCNIIESVISKLLAFQYGTLPTISDDIILENYAEYINCPCIDLVICNTSNCSNEQPVVYNCSLTVQRIDISIATVIPVQTTFVAIVPNPPTDVTYEWTYNPLYFEGTGTIITTTAFVSLVWKPYFAVNDIITDITVKVTDKVGCADEKTCSYNPYDGMRCSPYVSCYNINGLIVNVNPTPCIAANSLAVLPVVIFL